MKPSLFNTALPIIQAPMAGVQNEQLALAVSEAGGLGSLPCAMLSPAQLVEQLEILSHKTTKPFNLNFFCHTVADYTPALACITCRLLYRV